MNTPQPGRACPVDPHYPDPRPPDLDLAAIIGRGRRIRHRRRLAQLGAVLAACVAAGSVIAGARGFTIRMFPGQPGPAAGASAAPIDALVAEDPPANGTLTLISSWPRQWTTVAWATRSSGVCWATFRTPGQGATQNLDCPAWTRSDVPGSGGIAFSALVPDVTLASSGPGTAWPVLGLTNPQAVRVLITASGKDVSATVVPVPIGAGKTAGVFLAWIRAPGHSFASSDVTSEAAYDHSGHIIAHASNPP
ncbi:MAG: hypothetical protein ACRDPD_24005 [Streptosporangiaceae bacterium]